MVESDPAGVSRFLAPAIPAIVALPILLVLAFSRLRPPWMQARLARWVQLPAWIKVRQAVVTSMGVAVGMAVVGLIAEGDVNWVTVAASMLGSLVGWSILWLRHRDVAPSAGR